MKSIFRFGVLVLIALLVVSPAMFAQAQATDKQCFGLAAGDCDLLYSAFSPESTAQYTKGVTVDYALDIKVAGEESFNANVKGKAQAGGSGESAAFSTDLTAAITGGGDQEMSIPLSLRVTNDRLYINSMMVTQGNWQYLPLSMASSMTSQLEDSPASAATDPEKQAAFLKAVNTPGVVNSTVAEKSATDGTTVKEFSFAFDVAKFVQSPDLLPLIKESLAENPDAAEVDLDKAIPAIADVLKDTTFNVTFQVGADKLLRGFTLSLVSKIDEAGIQKLKDAGVEVGDEVESGIDMDVQLKIDLSGIGTAPVVEEPEDAEELDLSGMFGGMSGSN